MIETTQEYLIGDCLDLLPTIEDKSIDLIIADPPYNINKADWDNIPDYLNWCMSWIEECQRVLKDNGSMYIFHSEMPTIARLMIGIENGTDLIYKSMITWEKYQGNKQYFGRNVIMGVNADAKRNYYTMSEYILYYTLQDSTGLSKIMGDCVYPIRDYIRSEIIKAKGKIVLGEINLVLGTATNGGGVSSACLSEDKTVPAMMTEEHYLKIRDWLNCTGEYKYLRKEYEDLRKEYEDLRYTFNCHATDVTRTWLYPPAKKEGHATPKPVELLKNIILHSSNEGDLILDPFCGSGKTLRACRETNRNCLGIEQDKVNVDLIKKISLVNTPSLASYNI